MTSACEGNAIVYCDGAFDTTNGKTAHGLLRRSERFRIASVVDSRLRGRLTGEILRGCRYNVPIVGSVKEADRISKESEDPATHMIIGLAPDGGRLPERSREHVREAVSLGLTVVSGLHDFLSEDKELAILARTHGARIVDIRKPKDPGKLHFFSGKIEEVSAPRIAILGTDSAVGKRTTAWMLIDGFRAAGTRAAFVGTGQTAWLQGASHGVVFDALINDFVSGEIEHAVWSAWRDLSPEVIVVEGQGSLMNPAYPGGFEILAAARPSCVVLQHAPSRSDYDGFPGYPIHPIEKQIQAIELISGKRVAALAINSEGLNNEDIEKVRLELEARVGLPAVDPLESGVGAILDAVAPYIVRPDAPADSL